MNGKYDALFDPESLRAIQEFFDTRERWQAILEYRQLTAEAGHVKNMFYGDSITDGWPLHEFFPNTSLLNRGIGGDNINGLYLRLDADVFPYTPEKVFILVGINGIEWPKQQILDKTRAVASMIRERGSRVYLGSILPLREPDEWDRFRYQEKIVEINAEQKAWSERNLDGYLDYHTPLKDASGQLAAEYARPDGTHLTFAAYRVMADVVRPHLA
ncbi:MAG: hypothetical protein HPZ91_02695 [Lentisphaeria bacterium]|nr:hypothetical protein [Lentisphaeria bacterium]